MCKQPEISPLQNGQKGELHVDNEASLKPQFRGVEMEDASSKSRKSTHVVLCTSQGKGHVNPVMTLACKLASLGLSITVVFPDEMTMSLVSSARPSSIAGLDIELVKLPLDEVNEHESKKHGGFASEMTGVRLGVRSELRTLVSYEPQQKALETLLCQMMETPSPPACVIVDMLLSWTEQPITKLRIARFQLYTAAATYLPLLLVARMLYKQGVLPICRDDKLQLKEKLDRLHVPGLPVKLGWLDFPDAISDSSHSLYDVHQSWVDHMLTSDGILFNTFSDFESDLFDALRTQYQEMEHVAGSLLTVGPLFPKEYFGPEAMLATKKSSILRGSAEQEELCQEWLDSHPPGSAEQEELCQEWLDSHPPGSVVYISFGSWALLSSRQVRELAIGLEATKQRFLWRLPGKSNEDLEKLLPEGFMERNAGKGLILSDWAPQHLILTHSSTGSFLSHCGWNSTLECITLAGIPMICWPFLADQPPNCRYLVEGVRIAVEVHGDEAEGFVTAEEVERAVKQVMEGPDSEEMRIRARDLKAAAKRAVDKGGSSHENLQGFISRVKNEAASVAP